MMAATAGLAGATPITNFGSGILQAGNGSVVVSGNGLTGGCIIWYNGGTPPDTCPTSGTGNLTVEGGSTSPFAPGETGTIQNLNFNETLPLKDFIVIPNGTSAPFEFDLADIRVNGGTPIGDGCSGAGETAPGDDCTLPLSPFELENGLTDPTTGKVDTVSISFTVDAYGYEGSSGINYSAANLYVGTFSTQQAITNASIQTILTQIESGNSVNASWSATFQPEASTPEPATFLIFGAGLTLVGLYKRKASRS